MKDSINQRFIDVVSFLVKEKIETRKSNIALKLNMKQNKLSDILSKRLGIGLDAASLLCEAYNVSSVWLLTGKGSMFNEPSPAQAIPEPIKEIPEPPPPNLEEMMGILKALVKSLQEQVAISHDLLKSRDERIQQLKEENYQLKIDVNFLAENAKSPGK